MLQHIFITLRIQLLLAVILWPGLIAAQTVHGTVTEPSGAPIPFTNVALYASDSTLVTGTTTDMDGRFSITGKPGSFYIESSFLSFQTIYSDVFQLAAGSTFKIGQLVMKENAQMLEEVVIEAERSQMEFKLDRRVFNVGADLSNAGSNASEILANVPSVDVDIDGNVSLRGSENVRILVDGKQSGLTGSGNADALRMLQGNMVEKIEVITNPSSKYEAEGEVGIINIVLKKEKQKGFNGTFEVQGGHPTNYGASYSINYRRKWINLFASSGLNYRRRPGQGSSFQEYNGPDTTYRFQRDRDHRRGGLSTVNRVGADFYINDKNILTTSLLYKYADADNTALIEYRDLNQAEEVVLSTIRDEEENEISQDIEIALTHVKTFEQEDREWTTDFRITQNDDSEIAQLTQTSSSPFIPNSFQRSSNTEDERNYILQSDYIQPIGKKGKFETGVRASIRRIENFYSVDLKDSANAEWEPLTDFTDELIYTENIYAAYALYGNEWKRFSYQLGLRSEYTDIQTELRISKQVNPRSYLNFFPSAHLNYELSEFNSLQVSYSRRLSRPSFRELIPFFSYTDPRNFYGGNPDLDPEYTDSYEAGFLSQFDRGSILTSLYYRHTTANTQRITLTDTTGLIRTFPINLGTQDAYGLEVNMSYDIADWWRFNANVNAYYASIQGEYRGVSYNTDVLTMSGRLNTMITLPQEIDVQGALRYQAPQNTPQGRRLSITSLDLGASRDVFNGNGTLIFSVKDVFNSRFRRSIVETEFLYSESQFQWRARQFLLTFSYRINKQKRRGGKPDGLMDEY
jgi:outer membrane receptor protein involved in Fe transport